MTGSTLVYEESSGAFRRRCRFMAGWGHFHACGLVSLALHVVLLGGLLLTIAPPPPARPAGQAGSGRLIVHLIQEGTRQSQAAFLRAAEPSPKTVAPKSVAPPAKPTNRTASMPIAPAPVAPSPVTTDMATPVMGLGLPTGTSLPVPGQRRLFSPPTPHQGRSGPSFSDNQPQDEQLQWEQRQKAAQQALLRQQAVERHLAQWIVQLRSILSQIEKLSCQLAEEVTCASALPPEVQAIVEQGFRQLYALDPWQPRYTLVVADGAVRLNPEPAVDGPAAPLPESPLVSAETLGSPK